MNVKIMLVGLIVLAIGMSGLFAVVPGLSNSNNALNAGVINYARVLDVIPPVPSDLCTNPIGIDGGKHLLYINNVPAGVSLDTANSYATFHINDFNLDQNSGVYEASSHVTGSPIPTLVDATLISTSSPTIGNGIAYSGTCVILKYHLEFLEPVVQSQMNSTTNAPSEVTQKSYSSATSIIGALILGAGLLV